jgi:hypothetical protein
MAEYTPAYRTNIFEDNSGKYRWVYELPMLKVFFLLFEVWKVLVISALIVGTFLAILSVIEDKSLEGVLFAFEMAGLCLGILFVLSIPAYWIVTKANNGKYTVLFEMDDSGIDHIQIKSDKAKALDTLAVFVSLLARNRTGTAAAMLSAGGGTQGSPTSEGSRLTGRGTAYWSTDCSSGTRSMWMTRISISCMTT